MNKIPYRVSGEGDTIYEMHPISDELETAFFTSPFFHTGRKAKSKATIVPKKEIKERIERLERELNFLKTFYE